MEVEDLKMYLKKLNKNEIILNLSNFPSYYLKYEQWNQLLFIEKYLFHSRIIYWQKLLSPFCKIDSIVCFPLSYF
jgi:hypothetical protein